MVKRMNKYDENGRNRYYIDNGVVHMDVYNLCNVDNCDVLFDEQFLDKIICRTWRQVSKPGGVYISTAGKKDDATKHITMHRFIMMLAGNDIVNKEIDHINGNKFDNRLSNLRIVNHKQQMLNLPPTHRNKFGVRGVTDGGKFDQPYRVFFNYNHCRINLKQFATLPEAVYVRYLLESYYFDNVVVMRHLSSMQPYINLLSDQQKEDLNHYIDLVIEKYPKEMIA